ncbi:hypothetical protein COL26b_010052 [Colletotrichum chrysophilum]|uniref:uncharacterized protein n=1 Tax=Colletotrichum chrysophilum TaxID=1836956 RepID=UPI002300DA3F|nr:uncharacterized protein COL26b_010052 [Colletotrichum chrysophilum]KAJ0370483.1 hypothetical protein COL26b_010052 [Colletotrichum chrysophilum]
MRLQDFRPWWLPLMPHFDTDLGITVLVHLDLPLPQLGDDTPRPVGPFLERFKRPPDGTDHPPGPLAPQPGGLKLVHHPRKKLTQLGLLLSPGSLGVLSEVLPQKGVRPGHFAFPREGGHTAQLFFGLVDVLRAPRRELVILEQDLTLLADYVQMLFARRHLVIDVHHETERVI